MAAGTGAFLTYTGPEKTSVAAPGALADEHMEGKAA